MMVEKMMYVNLMGHIDDLDRVIEQYVAGYDIQLERASSEMAEKEGLMPFASGNPYQAAVKSAEKFLSNPEFDFKGKSSMTGEKALNVMESAQKSYEDTSEKLRSMIDKGKRLEAEIAKLSPFANLSFDLSDIFEFNLISLNFGKMPLSNFKQLEAFLYVDPEILFLEASRSKEYVWGVYATPRILKEKIDSIFSSLHFESVELPREFDGEILKGTPYEAIQDLKGELSELKLDIASLKESEEGISKSARQEVAEAAFRIRELYSIYDAKKYAAKTPKEYFVFVGWMSERDTFAFQKEVAHDNSVIFMADYKEGSDAPPTKLRNPPIIRFFEFFTKMYGLPSYGEIDPTCFLAFTYTILFGFMFGDVGQGAVIALAGALLYKLKRMALGAIMAVIGLSSVCFGFLYGSLFGFEEILPALWRRPNDDIMYTLMIAVFIGVFLILSAMALNIANAVKQRKWAKLVLSPNGLAGLVFYVAVAGAVAGVVLNQATISIVLIAAFVAVPLLLIAFREPMTTILERKKLELDSGVGMFFLETVIGLFEVLLTYFTNTVSFVRVGAFALSHAGMMGVVMLLSHAADGSRNMAVVVLGNILVMALEGLVVGIQVLRLQFYEMFSRFFEGDGREFVSYRSAKALK